MRGNREMNAEEVQRLIAQGEGPRLEFKRSLAALRDGVRTIAAFANADGGTLLQGLGFTNQRYREHFGVISKTAARDLGGLVEVGQTRRLGQGRGVRYVAT